MSIEQIVATQPEQAINPDLAAGSAVEETNINIVDNDFADDFDLFSDELGGVDSGIGALVKVRFNAGINENVKFLGFEWKADENYKMISAKFVNFDGWEESYPMFIPEARTYTTKEGKEVTTWFPKKMYDANKLPIEDNSQARRRSFGGVALRDENGKVKRDATNQIIYRNETEQEAKIRQMIDFKRKLNSFVAVFCRDNLTAALNDIAAEPRVTGWLDMLQRIEMVINKYCPNYYEVPCRLKLHRKYDKTTSNKRSEKFMQLPETMEYGMFLEPMIEGKPSIITMSNYEQDKLIAAPTKQTPQAGLNTPSGAGVPMGGTGIPMPSAIPSPSAMVGAMPQLNK